MNDTSATQEIALEARRVRRRLQIVGWVMVVWATLAILAGLVFARFTLLIFYSLLLAMGWRALRTASSLQRASSEAVLGCLGRAYVLQSWLVLVWIALGIITASWQLR